MKVHFVYRPGSRRDRRMLKYRPGAVVMDEPWPPDPPDYRLFRRLIRCLGPRQREELLQKIIARRGLLRHLKYRPGLAPIHETAGSPRSFDRRLYGRFMRRLAQRN